MAALAHKSASAKPSQPHRRGTMSNRDALRLWHNVCLDNVIAQAPDLTPRQLVVLTTIYLEPGPHTVRSLAAKMNVTKAVITRALDTLEKYLFVERSDDPRDKRSMIVRRTARGSVYLTQFAETIRGHMRVPPLRLAAS